MSEPTHHATHPAIVKRLKRANGYLASVISMIEDAQPCVDIAQQLHAVEKAVQQAKRTLIKDHIDHCLALLTCDHNLLFVIFPIRLFAFIIIHLQNILVLFGLLIGNCSR